MSFDIDAELALPDPGAPPPRPPAPTLPDPRRLPRFGAPPATTPDRVAPGGVADVVAGRPVVSGGESLARGGLQGLTSGWSDELAGRIDQGVSHIPGVRDLADHFRAPGAPPLNDPNVSYEDRRDFYRGLNANAQAQHPKTYLGGELLGGVAQAAIPGAKALGPVGAGGMAGAGYSNADNADDVAGDTLKGAAIGGLAAGAGKLVGAGAKKLAETAPGRVVGRELSKLGEGVKKSLRAQLATPQVEKKVANIITTDPAIKKALRSPTDLVAAADAGAEKASAEAKPIYAAADDAAAEARAASATGKSIDEAPRFTIPRAEPIGKGGIPRDDIASVFDRAAAEAERTSQHPHQAATIERLKKQFLSGIGKDDVVPSFEVRQFLSKQLQRPAFGGDPNVDPNAAKEATQKLAVGLKSVLDEHILSHAPPGEAQRLLGTGGINDRISAYNVIGNVAQEQAVSGKVPGVAAQVREFVTRARDSTPLLALATGHPIIGAGIVAVTHAPKVIDRAAATSVGQLAGRAAPSVAAGSARAISQPTIEALVGGDEKARRAAVHQEVFGR